MFSQEVCFSVVWQEPVTLIEYSMIGVTEGIDAIATTRVVIRVENSDMVAGEISQRTFRYGVFTLLCFQVYLNVSNMNL